MRVWLPLRGKASISYESVALNSFFVKGAGMLFKKKKKKAGGEEGPENEESAAGSEEAQADSDAGEGAAGVADEDLSPEEREARQKKRKKKRLIVLGGVLVLVLAVGVGTAAFFAGKFHFFKKPDTTEVSVPTLDPNAGAVYYTLPEFLVNLNTTSKQSSFLKMTVVLQVADAKDTPKIEAAMPRILDNLNTYLRELRATDLAGSAGIHRLREELMVRLNKTLSPVEVTDVLFKEIIVQ